MKKIFLVIITSLLILGGLGFYMKQTCTGVYHRYMSGGGMINGEVKFVGACTKAFQEAPPSF